MYPRVIVESSRKYPECIPHQPSVQCSSAQDDQGTPPETFKEARKALRDTMSLSDRKRCWIYTPDDRMREKMKEYVYNIYKLFDDSHNAHDCWLHPAPPPVSRNGRPVGHITCEFIWKDSSGRHRLIVNFGIVALLIKHHLTTKQMEGYVNQSWHLSHLCGNWTCCNWKHLTVESGPINISRNQCFPKATHCSHDPPCMKDRKRHFSVTPANSSHIQRAIDFSRIDSRPATQLQTYPGADPGFSCGICAAFTYCHSDGRICRSLTSVSRCQKALRELESCLVPNVEILQAIGYLKQIIRDLFREKKASASVL